jgi:hypothetical protein
MATDRIGPKRDARNLRIQCISDPTGTYSQSGFAKGDFDASLKEGNWPPGSVWIDTWTGHKFRVVGNEAWHHMWEIKGEAPDEASVRQRRERV